MPSSTSRNSSASLVGVALVAGLSLVITGILTAWNNDSSNASAPFANPGDILIAGGDVGALAFGSFPQALLVNSTKSAQLFQTSSGTFVATASMTGDREGATATALPDGTILVAGGLHCTNSSSNIGCAAINTAELYDPVSGKFTVTGSMGSNRFGQSATPISCGGCPLDGDVLMAGGDSGHFSVTLAGGIDSSKEKAVNTAEVYDYRTKTFTTLPKLMTSAREAHVAVTVPNGGGKIVLIGGDDKGFFIESVNTAEIFDPSNSTFTATGSMSSAREIAPAIALDPSIVNTTLAGQILVCGGVDAVNSGSLNGKSLDTCELFNPSGGTFTVVPGTLSSPRTGESLTLFPGGKLSGQVLIAGGVNAVGAGSGPSGLSETSTATCDLFNPSGPSGALSPTGSLNEPRGGHAVALLSTGPNASRVLVAGGERCVPPSSSPASSCYVVSTASDQSNGGTADAGELFDSDTATWSAVTAPMQPPVNAAAGFGVPIPGPSSAGTPTATPTSNATASATASATSNASPSATTTATAAPTATGTGVPTATGTPTQGATSTSTGNPTATSTGNPTATSTGTSIPTATATLTATVVATVTPTAAPTSTPPPVPASLVVRPVRISFNPRKTSGKISVFNPQTRKQDSPIQIVGKQISGDFVIDKDTCGASVAPGARCEYDVTFKPSKAGMSQGSFAVSDNSSSHSSSTVTLMGMVKVAPLAMKPMRLNFGKEPVNSSSAPQTVTVQNGNPIAVDVTVAGGGAHPGDYQIGNGCPASVSAGQSCSVNVTFAPTATGNRSAVLVITNAGKNRNVALTGTGTAGGPTPTATATTPATATSTPAATPTGTATSTSAATPTDTAIATPTATITIGLPTATPTSTPSATATGVPTPAATMTIGIPTPTITIGLPTATPTNTPSVTPTAVATETPTDTPTATFTIAIPTPTITIGIPTAIPTLPML
jgi:hypothetical protein